MNKSIGAFFLIVSFIVVIVFIRKLIVPITHTPIDIGSMTSSTEPTYTEKPSLISVSNVLPGGKIQSPVVVKGEARGYWFFEASFPIEVRDKSGNVLGRGIATAEGEWMTEDFVPFSATIEFSPSGNTEGFLALVKDNPSGLPEHDDELLLPVRF